MDELRIVEMDKKQYMKILEISNDENKDCCYWDYPMDEVDYLMECLLDMSGIDVRYMALIDKRLYELPEDWKSFI